MTDGMDDALPSKRAEKAEEYNQKLLEQAQSREAMLREDFARTFQTEHGKRVLAYIMQRSGFGRVILSADANKAVDPMATTFAAMELNFYLDIRRHIPIEVLQQVEYGFVLPSGTTDSADEIKRKTTKPQKGKKK